MKRLAPKLAVAAVAVTALVTLTACGSSGSGSANGKTTITLLVDNGDATVKAAAAEVAAFEKANPDIRVKTETRPGGSDGDNLVKTKLSTGDMQDVFWYNSGSLMQALSPEKTLVDLTNDPALQNTDPKFLPVVTQNGKVYGAPWGTAFGGGILYNKDVYAKLNLQVPKTWADLEANSETIKAASITPVVGTFKDTWTSQLLVLGDFYNVALADPSFAKDYTANKAKYASTPAALRSFEKTAEPHAKGWLNKGAGSSTMAQGLTLLTSGKAAQFPMLTAVLGGSLPTKLLRSASSASPVMTRARLVPRFGSRAVSTFPSRVSTSTPRRSSSLSSRPRPARTPTPRPCRPPARTSSRTRRCPLTRSPPPRTSRPTSQAATLRRRWSSCPR